VLIGQEISFVAFLPLLLTITKAIAHEKLERSIFPGDQRWENPAEREHGFKIEFSPSLNNDGTIFLNLTREQALAPIYFSSIGSSSQSTFDFSNDFSTINFLFEKIPFPSLPCPF
jgi:hypothetical protein